MGGASILGFDDLDWVDIEIPDGSPEVRLARLTQTDGGSLSLVEFPPGWSRSTAGHYEVAEEAVWLEGSFEMSGERHAAGEYCWFPPGYSREASRSPSGALAMAWFGGAPRWFRHESDRGAPGGAGTRTRWKPATYGDESPLGDDVPGRRLHTHHHHDTWVLGDVTSSIPVPAPLEILSWQDRVIVLAPRGSSLPTLAGPNVCRVVHR